MFTNLTFLKHPFYIIRRMKTFHFVFIVLLSYFLSSTNAFGQSTTINFNYTGSAQIWVVPNCVYNITVVVKGAKGGGSAGGLGANVTATLAVTPGQILQINVGGTGTVPAPGWNGGGNGTTANPGYSGGFGGGGASDIRVAPNALANRLIVGAGGGGTGGGNTNGIGGSGGCTNGLNGSSPFGQGGGGGTQFSGGTPGPPWIPSGSPGTAGSLGLGGNGGSDPCYNRGPGAGGGGGKYGGGGGGSDCFGSGPLGGGGGGGGSSLIPTGGTCLQGNNNGLGFVSITYLLTSPPTVATNTGPYCAGQTIQLNSANGGNLYNWTGPNSYVQNNTQNPTLPSATPAQSGIYTVTVTYPGGCVSTATTSVIVNPLPVTSAGPNLNICLGNCTNLTCVVTNPTSYSWVSIPGNINVGNSSTINVCPIVTTTYVVTATALACSNSDTIVVIVTSMTTAAAGVDDSVCAGACTTLQGSGGVSYSWAPAAAIVGSSTIANPQACPIVTTVYTVTVTDANGCIGTDQVTVFVAPSLLSLNITTIDPTCFGYCNGSATAAAAGGFPPYTYLWSNAQTTPTGTNLCAGPLSLTITDAIGCTSTVALIITQPATATISIINSINTTCNGICDGSATALAAGGTGPYSYSWNTTPAQLTINATNLCAGNYIITMIDSNGCVDTSMIAITQPAVLTNLASGTTTICIGQTANLTSVASGGTPIYNYSWTDGITNWSTANIAVSPTVTTTYTVSLTDANGCVAINQTITVTVNPPLNVVAMAGISVCAHSNINITALANGGNGNITYTWQPGNLIGASINIPIAVSTTYTVTATDGCGTPSSSDTVTVMVNPLPIVTIVAATATSGCQPLCVTFTNNTPNTNSIAWTFGNNLGNSTSPNPTFCFSTFGIYDVSATVTDNLGCVGTTTLTNYITIWPLPNALFSASPQPTTILENSVTFTDLSTGANAWIWSFGADLYASTIQNPVYAFQDTGVFAVQLLVTNQYGCQDSITMPIEIKLDYALYIPNAFTPNGDYINDVFFPLGMGVSLEKFKFYIFDRWGNIIFNTDNTTVGWDGTVQGTGRLCQLDTYVYKITAMDPDGELKVYIGAINLIR